MSEACVLGIIAGGGSLPGELAQACEAASRPCFVLAFNDSPELNPIRHLPHAILRIGAIGEALSRLRQAGVREVVMAGHMRRPSLFSLKPDQAATRLLAKLGKAFFGGDDALLKALVAFLEEEGFKVVGADAILGALLTPSGVLGRIQPSAQAKADIEQGIVAARRLGELDIGQAAIVRRGELLGLEDAAGTDALLKRCAAIKHEGGGVLVKVKKPGQEARVDLPAIGPQTVGHAHAANLAGIALEAGGSLLLEKEKTIALADHLGLFILGF